MKAIVVREFGAANVMKLESVATPAPAAGQVLVRVEATGINPVETYIRSGKYPTLPQLPYTPGKDCAGTVADIGPNVRGWKIGDRVYTADTLTGAYAEFVLCGESQLGRLPDEVSFEQGAGVWTPYATAYRALFEKANARSGETVLVHGASGGVGIAAIQWSKSRGLRVIGSAGSDEGKALVKREGADLAVDHLSAERQAEAAKDAILMFTENRGVNVIVEMLANRNLALDFSVLSVFGRIAIVGSRGTLEFDPRLTMSKDASIFGLSLFNAEQPQRDKIHQEIYKGLSEKSIVPRVSDTFPITAAPAAHERLMTKSSMGKIVLKPTI